MGRDYKTWWELKTKQKDARIMDNWDKSIKLVFTAKDIAQDR